MIGQDGQQVLVKHASSYVRVHPCNLQLFKERDIKKNVDSNRFKTNSANDNKNDRTEINEYSEYNDMSSF